MFVRHYPFSAKHIIDKPDKILRPRVLREFQTAGQLLQRRGNLIINYTATPVWLQLPALLSNRWIYPLHYTVRRYHTTLTDIFIKFSDPH